MDGASKKFSGYPKKNFNGESSAVLLLRALGALGTNTASSRVCNVLPITTNTTPSRRRKYCWASHKAVASSKQDLSGSLPTDPLVHGWGLATTNIQTNAPCSRCQLNFLQRVYSFCVISRYRPIHDFIIFSWLFFTFVFRDRSSH